LCELLTYEKFEIGQPVYKFKEPNDKMYIIIEGKVDFQLNMKKDNLTTKEKEQLAYDINCPNMPAIL
jgi:hypothetical protein